MLFISSFDKGPGGTLKHENLEGFLEPRLELAAEVALLTVMIQPQNEDTNISHTIVLNLCFMGICTALHNKIASSS